MKICVFGASGRELDRDYYEAAEELGALIAEHGHTLVFGGSRNGLMGAAAHGAAVCGGKVIGVDVDQAAIIDAYGEGMTVTSAMKGLAPTVKAILGELILKDNWAQYAGQINTLGLVSGTDVEANYVQIPYESTQWSDTFTKDDYAALVAAMFDGTVTVSNDTETEPTVQTITVDYQGNIK